MTKTAKTTAKPKGVSVHLGLNSVSAAHYEGWSGELNACEADANDMAAIAKGAGMKSTVLLTKKATRNNALAAVRSAAKSLKSGDLLFLTYSGHGGQIQDVTGEEADKLDETWCLYDGELIDDEVYLELSRFAKGVRVLVLSDSCHSGTVTRAMPPRGADAPAGRSKMMPPAVAMRTYRQHQAFYDKLQRDVAKAAGKSSSPDPDTALAHVAVSHRLTVHRQQLQGVGDPDLRLPGQPDLDGRRPQRRVHRTAADGLEPRQVRGELREVPRRHQGADAAHAGAEPVYARPGGRLRGTAAVQRVTPPW